MKSHFLTLVLAVFASTDLLAEIPNGSFSLSSKGPDGYTEKAMPSTASTVWTNDSNGDPLAKPIADFQTASAELAVLSNLSTMGFVQRTGAATYNTLGGTFAWADAADDGKVVVWGDNGNIQARSLAAYAYGQLGLIYSDTTQINFYPDGKGGSGIRFNNLDGGGGGILEWPTLHGTIARTPQPNGAVNLAGGPFYITGLLPLANFADGTALSVVGRSANSAGVQASIAAGTDGSVLRRSGTTLAFGEVTTAGIANSAVTLAKLANITGPAVLGRAAATGAPTSITAATSGHVLRRSGVALGFGSLDLGDTATFTGWFTGITNASEVAAGKMGEYMEDATASPDSVPLTTATDAEIASLSLTAGDWEVEGMVTIGIDGGTCEERTAWISLDTSPIERARNSQEFPITDGNSNIDRQSLVIPRTRVNVSSGTTLRLETRATYSGGGGGLTATGFVSARRVR